MDFYILDSDFCGVDIVQNAESLVWKKCYCDPGSFEIYTIASAANVDLLQIGRYVTRLDDDMVGIIEKISIQKDDDGRDMLLASGRCAKSLFARRIIQPQQVFTGTVWNRMYWMIYRNAAEPTAEYRKIPGISIADVDPGIKGASDQTQHTGTNLMDAVIELLAANDLGWKVTTDGTGEFTVSLIAGKDRSVEQTDNEPVLFSDDLDNLASSDYEKDMTSYANVAHIAGEGEGSARVWAGIDITGGQTGISGLDRYELFVDARDLQKTSTDSSGKETTMTDAAYMEALKARGLEKLKDTQYTESFEGEADWGTYQYRVDYDVGDIVTIRNQFGISANIRIVAVEEIEDEDGYTVTPILADCTSVERNQSSSVSGSASGGSAASSSGGGSSEDLATIRANISSLRSDVSYLESGVNTNKSDISSLRSDLSSLEDRVDTLEANGGSGGDADTTAILKAVYPVGAIYIATASTSPASLFGFGTWSRIQGQFLLGASSSYPVNSTGGEATHTLTEDEIPVHRHSIYNYNASGSTSGVYAHTVGGYTAGSSADTSPAGGGKAHNNMPPYVAVYMWKRTA